MRGASLSLIELAENGRIPDTLLRAGIRQLLAQRLRDEQRGSADEMFNRQHDRLTALGQGPVAIETDAANEQHYEVPAEFFR